MGGFAKNSATNLLPFPEVRAPVDGQLDAPKDSDGKYRLDIFQRNLVLSMIDMERHDRTGSVNFRPRKLRGKNGYTFNFNLEGGSMVKALSGDGWKRTFDTLHMTEAASCYEFSWESEQTLQGSQTGARRNQKCCEPAWTHGRQSSHQ